MLGVSDRFVITSALAVSEPRLELGLRGSVPNPSRNLSVSFTLPGSKPATLVIYDISGREVSRREVAVWERAGTWSRWAERELSLPGSTSCT